MCNEHCACNEQINHYHTIFKTINTESLLTRCVVTYLKEGEKNDSFWAWLRVRLAYVFLYLQLRSSLISILLQGMTWPLFLVSLQHDDKKPIRLQMALKEQNIIRYKLSILYSHLHFTN